MLDNTVPPSNVYPQVFGLSGSPKAFNSASTFGGLDASSESSDTYSSRQGQKG